jgi:hypothetical protein
MDPNYLNMMTEYHLLANFLHRFSAGSANDHTHKHLWFKGANLFIDQINALLKYVNYKPNIVDISEFDNENSKLLSDYFNKYKSDKSITHNYNIMYSYILNKLGRDNQLNILEIGLGSNNPDIVSSMGSDGNPGASLYTWEEYLPNSQIYGADVDKDILFNKDRIKTQYVDQLDIKTFINMQTNFNVKYDLIIDDGLHAIGANLNTLLFAIENVNDGGWIVIEDIASCYIDNWFIIDYILKQKKDLEVTIVKASRSHMFIIHKL